MCLGTGPALYEHFVAVGHQHRRAARRYTDAFFIRIALFRETEFQGGPLRPRLLKFLQGL